MRHLGQKRMGKWEFIALIAMMFGTIAFSVDAILPAYPSIEAELAPAATGRVHLMITLFMAGLAFGTLIAGPLSDAIGRRPTMFVGAALYISAGTVAWLSNSFEVIVIARFVQGFGAAGPRVVSLAIVRDLYEGRAMAQIVSFAMVLFTIVPTLAPAMGDVLSHLFGWRSILLFFIVFSLLSTFWIWARLDEPLPVEARRPFRIAHFISAGREILAHPTVRLSIAVQSLSLALIFCLIVSVQPIYDIVFGRGESFAYWFGGIALFAAASTSLANAALVMRFGMRLLVTIGMCGQMLSASLALILLETQPELAFQSFVLFQFLLIFLSGLCVGNLNALALEPMGHIAGFTASVTGATSTILAAAVASFVGFQFDGTPIPLVISALVLSTLGFGLMLRMRRWALVA
ncbi:MAG: MFS transporter [Aliishimia sp.]